MAGDGGSEWELAGDRQELAGDGREIGERWREIGGRWREILSLDRVSTFLSYRMVGTVR